MSFPDTHKITEDLTQYKWEMALSTLNA